MGCSSPAGSDANISNMGIVQGHAYSILDIFEVEGNKLLQLRNPWGNDKEWKGAWSDQSSDWTERRRQIIYERARQRGVEAIKIGEADGTFWMNYVDWFTNFASISMVKYFDENSFTEINYISEWSIAK
jgi:Calpain family cysteine protease